MCFQTVAMNRREQLTSLYRAGVAAADPRSATRRAVARLEDLTPEVWVFAVGKGAHAMATGAVEALEARRVLVGGGFVVSHTDDAGAGHGLEHAMGDHPVPRGGSSGAADRLRDALSRAPARADAVVLVSGGTTSLIAAPVEGITGEGLREAFDVLLASGADIVLMNEVRKRILRFGGGGLARALSSRRVHCLIASDVIGNDPASIGSGPCVPVTTSSGAVRTLAEQRGVWDKLPRTVRARIDAAAADGSNHDRFATTAVKVILDRTDAERGVAEEARRLGMTPVVRREPLAGEAAPAGETFGRDLVAEPGDRCVIWSGECTVTIGDASGTGGRCQEFALACALELERAGSAASRIAVLAAGTDGRDGPTDAAGAIVDVDTCTRIRSAGTDPELALRAHDSYHALDAAGSLLRTGPTGTNVNDLVIGLLQPSPWAL